MNRSWHIAVMLCVSTLVQAQHGDELMTTPIRWKGVEVVTNDFESVDAIRSAAAFPDGSVMLMSDPRLKSTCAAVRTFLPSAAVTCSPLLGEGTAKAPHAWYVIEVDIPKRRALSCIGSAPPLKDELTSLLEAWKAAQSRALLSGDPIRDFVNDDRHLDYQSPALSKLAKEIHATVRDRARELEAAGASCNPRERENAFYLMSFVGNPQRFIALAAYHIHDEDADAANAATRFLAVFTDFIDASFAPRLAAITCSTLDGGLTARNKSLVLLSKLKMRRAIAFDHLDADCQTKVRNIARTSRAEIVAEPALELLAP